MRIKKCLFTLVELFIVHLCRIQFIVNNHAQSGFELLIISEEVINDEIIMQLEALVHPFFDELRDPNTRLPNGRFLPPLFNFKAHGKK